MTNQTQYLTPLTPEQFQDVQELIRYTEANRKPLRKPRHRKRDPDIAPRPLNCFLIYRREKQQQIRDLCVGVNHRLISKVVAKWWKTIDFITKKLYLDAAKKVKQEHLAKFPNYRYSPKRKRLQEEEEEKNDEEQQQQPQQTPTLSISLSSASSTPVSHSQSWPLPSVYSLSVPLMPLPSHAQITIDDFITQGDGDSFQYPPPSSAALASASQCDPRMSEINQLPYLDMTNKDSVQALFEEFLVEMNQLASTYSEHLLHSQAYNNNTNQPYQQACDQPLFPYDDGQMFSYSDAAEWPSFTEPLYTNDLVHYMDAHTDVAISPDQVTNYFPSLPLSDVVPSFLAYDDSTISSDFLASWDDNNTCNNLSQYYAFSHYNNDDGALQSSIFDTQTCGLSYTTAPSIKAEYI